MPSMPIESSCVSGKAPSAISVVATGSRRSSASLRISGAASEVMAPPPRYSTGRWASLMALAAARICLMWPLNVGL